MTQFALNTTAHLPSAYRVHLLADPRPTERGILYRRGENRFLVEWDRVERALAAEVGEREGVMTVVFDLVVEMGARGCVACRFDADPGEAAQAIARAIELGVGRDRCSPALRSTASDGWPSRTYPDVESFEQAALESVRFR
jgi:hypothetical protein